MITIWELVLLLMLGGAGGLLAGLLGIGGGLIYVVVLSYFFNQYDLDNVEVVRYVVANSIFAAFFAGISGTYRQLKNRHYYGVEILVTAIPGVLASLSLTWFIINFDWYTRESFSIFFFLILCFFAYKLFFYTKKHASHLGTRGMLTTRELISGGFMSGILSALSGLGGGVLLIPYFSGFLRLNIKKAGCIALGIIPYYAVSLGMFYAFANGSAPLDMKFTYGYLSLPVVLPISLGVVAFTPLGLKLSEKLRQKTIRWIFGAVLAFLALNMLIVYLDGVY